VSRPIGTDSTTLKTSDHVATAQAARPDRTGVKPDGSAPITSGASQDALGGQVAAGPVERTAAGAPTTPLEGTGTEDITAGAKAVVAAPTVQAQPSQADTGESPDPLASLQALQAPPEEQVAPRSPMPSDKTRPQAERDGYFVQIVSETQTSVDAGSVEAAGSPQPTASVIGTVGGTSEGPPLGETEDTDGPEPVGLQIARVVQGGSVREGRQVVIRLNPPELGSVRIALRTVDNTLRGLVTVDNPRTFAALQNETPALVDRLSGADIRVTRMEVILNDNDASTGSGSHASGSETDQAGLYDGRHDQNAAQQDARADARGDGGETDGAFADAPPEAMVSNESINMWI